MLLSIKKMSYAEELAMFLIPLTESLTETTIMACVLRWYRVQPIMGVNICLERDFGCSGHVVMWFSYTSASQKENAQL